MSAGGAAAGQAASIAGGVTCTGRRISAACVETIISKCQGTAAARAAANGCATAGGRLLSSFGLLLVGPSPGIRLARFLARGGTAACDMKPLPELL